MTACAASGQTSWVTQATKNLPGNNGYSSAGAFNPWQESIMGFWRSNRTASNIYSDALVTFNPATNTWTELSFNGAANNGDCGMPDTPTMPGSGHVMGNHTYDWRHDLFFVHTRLGCGGKNSGYERTSLYTWMDNKDNPAAGFVNNGPWHQMLPASSPERIDGYIIYDPLNNNLVAFGGLVNLSPVNSMSVYTWATNTLTPVNYANSPPSIRSAMALWFDYYYADRHPGESRIGIYGGTYAGGALATDLNYFYPNGSASLGLSPNSWQLNVATNGTGPGLRYGWVVAYDTLRDIVWAFKNSTTVSALDVASSTWTDYPVSNGLTQCPANDCNMVYDSSHDKLIITGRNAGFAVQTLDLQALIPRTPSCGDNYPTSATATFVPRFVGYPAAGAQYRDPMGACVTRVSTASGPGDNAVTPYADIDPTDSSGRYLMLVNGKILDTQSGNKDLGVNYYNNLRNATWSRTTPGKLIGVGGNAHANNTIVGCSISGSSLSCSVMVNLSAKYSDCGSTSAMATASQEDLDQNDSYKILTCVRKSDNKMVMVVVNLQTGVSGAEMVIPPHGQNDGCSETLNFGPDYAYVGYQAKYALVNWGTPSVGSGHYCGMEAFDLAQAANPNGSWVRVGQVIPDQSHGDLAVYNGKEYFIAAQNGSWPGFPLGVTRCEVPDGWSRPGHAGCTQMLNSAAGHISAHAYGAKGTPSAIVSTYDGASNGNWNTRWGAFKNEIYQLYLDSTPAAPHLNRLAHHHSDVPYVEGSPKTNPNGCPNFVSYWAQPHASQTMDGTKVYFGSTWGPRCRAETFAISLNPSATAPPPTAASPCDLNGDGFVDSSDVQIGTMQVLGTAVCSADLNSDGKCDVVDLQRIINASLGGICRVGP